jgi:glucose-6-phosphate 1-epimerase
MNAAALTDRFRFPGTVAFADTEHGLTKAVVSHAGMHGELFLQGAQVAAWQPAGARPVIFTSPRSSFVPGKAIRGGVPVIYPWFGAHPTDPNAPQHGIARIAQWQLNTVENHPADAVTLELSFAADNFSLTYRVTFSADLTLSLTVRNTSPQAAAFEQALHTYFAVSDVERVTVQGLEHAAFIDKTANFARRPPTGAPLRFTKETDSVYLDTPDRLAIHDAGWGRRIVIAKTRAASTIVWKPWAEKAAAMADLGAENWHGMLCVETGNVADNRVTLPPGGAHTMTTRISLDAG